MSFKRIGLILLALFVVSSSVASCRKDSENQSSKKNQNEHHDSVPGDNADNKNSNNPVNNVLNNESSNITNDTQSSDTDDKPETTESDENTQQGTEVFINKLTGLETTEELSKQRPVAVMINNIKAALPQVGISEMDVLYEITVEGAITRLLGVKTDWASLPTIGSVRSSRDYFIDIADAHNAIYVHAGGSDYAYNVIWSRGTDNIDGTNGTYASGKAFYRDPHRRNELGMATEHTLVTNGENLAEAISGNGYSTEQDKDFQAPFKFNKTAQEFEGANAEYVYIPFSAYAQSYLDYDKKTMLYSKGQYLGTRSTLDLHESPHIDESTGEALEFTNILILSATHSNIAGDTKGRISVNFTGTGSGYYISHGTCKAIVWKKESRTSGYKLYEVDGTNELSMNPGKTYVAIVDKNTEIVYK